ncbi:MAG: glycosyltransferase [Bacteroidota bacterium]|nr:glycosyltransferase [Bacteroidota bacterium]MDP3144654.1 glycosyltransferase [Bacteroidota bacterium]
MKQKLLYFHAGKSSFVIKDIEILQEKYEVHEFFFNTTNKKTYLFEFIKQKLFILSKIFGAKLIVCQFAGHYSFLPILFAKLFFKKSVIIAGGTDCVSFPSIAYGNFSNKLMRFTTTFSFKNCDLILPVHQSLVEYDYTYQPNDFPKQGFNYFIKGLKTKVEVIPNGYDSKKWFCDSEKEKKSFITIGAGLGSRFGFSLKGIDLIFEIAPKFPDAIFYIVGGSSIKTKAPANVKLLENMANKTIQPLLSRMQFYLQLSLSEGFPNALSEGMLCECVPIVSNVGGMPDIVDACGYILNHKNLDELFTVIQSALNNNEVTALGKKARKRIEENYTFENRKTKLLSELQKLV